METAEPSATSTFGTTNMPLHMPPPPTDGAARGPWFPMWHITNNATYRDSLNYNIFDDLAQSPTTMSALDVLKMFPAKWKALLSALGVVDPSDSKVITFDFDQGEPKIPSTISFHILVSIQNLVLHRCIVDEGESTCVMSTFF